MHEIRNDLGLPYPKIIGVNYRVKLDSINKHKINLKAKELLLHETEAVTSSEELYAGQLMYWMLEEHPRLSSDDMLHAVLILLRNTEPKAAMEWLFKEQIPEMQLEMQRFQEEEEPTIAAVILFKRLAHKLQETELSPSSELLLPEMEYPPEEVLAMLGVTSSQNPPESPEQHLTPLGESRGLQSITPANVFSEQKFKRKEEKVGHHFEAQVKASNSATDYYNQGLAKNRLGQYEAAIVDYDNAIRLKPDYAFAYNNRGVAKYYLGQYKAAIADYDSAIRLKPDYALAYNNRGITKAKLEQCEAAIADYDSTLRLKPNHAAAYYNRGLAKYKFNQYEAAIADYDNAIRLEPDHLNAYYSRGLAKYKFGQYEAAIADYDNAIRLKPDYVDAYYERGNIKYILGQYEEAIVDYDNAIRLEPDDAYAYYDRGLAKKKLGQNSRAEQDWQTALKLATETGNIELKNLIDSVLHQPTGPQVKLDFKPKEEKVIHHSENQVKASEPLAKEKVVRYSEDQIKDIVTDYFKSLPTASLGYSVEREYPIQMGSSQRRADIAFLRNGKLVAIAECKRTGRVEKGNEQLHSYLCATDTFLGIFANDGDPNKWTFSENHRHNNFLEIDRETFENYIYNHDKAIKDREEKIKLEIEREIDAEIRERVRKNTDTKAIRQDETDHIKREVRENIDKTAIVNSVKSQIAQQTENGLLNKRDEENLKLGRSQGFWWTILSIIGIAVLIALLTSAA